jgi:hypothetical protein
MSITAQNLVTMTRFCDEILGAFGGYASATPNDEDGCPVLAQESRQNPVKRRDFVTRLFGWAAKSTASASTYRNLVKLIAILSAMDGDYVGGYLNH